MFDGEADARLANLVTPYGVGTRSYNRSAEKRELERQRKAATANYQYTEVVVPLICTCLSFRFPHPPSRHGSLKSDHDWTAWERRYYFNAERNSLEEKYA
jgi:hypothetical protein